MLRPIERQNDRVITELDEAPFREIAEAIEAKGARIGSSSHNLIYRLSSYALDRCDLGDLWN